MLLFDSPRSLHPASYWFGSEKGLTHSKLEEGKLTHRYYTSLDWEGNNSVIDIQEDCRGYLWICIMGSGVREFNPKNGKGYLTLGIAYLLKRDIDSAKKTYEKLKDIDEKKAQELYTEIERKLEERSHIEELTASGCFKENINAACFYTKAFFLLVLPPRDFYKNFNEKVKNIIDNGWTDNNEDFKNILNKNHGAIKEFKKALKLQKCDFTLIRNLLFLI